MATSENDLLERVAGVYEEARNDLPFGQSIRDDLAELDHLAVLHFNQYRVKSRPGQIAKKLLQKVTSPFLAKQVTYNTLVREILVKTCAAVNELEREVNDLKVKKAVPPVPSEEQRCKNSGLWFNDPIRVGYREDGEAYWDRTTERIVEKAFVLQSLARLYDNPEVSVLDVGAAESLLAYELASMGYSVTATDNRPIALFHPNLKFVKGDICKSVFKPSSFDCAIALSTLEHVGLGWYGDEVGPQMDHLAVQQIHRLLKPGGKFLLTVPYGKRAVTPVHRIYDKETVQALVGPFQVDLVEYGVRLDDFTMVVLSDEAEAADKAHDPQTFLPGAVAMLRCTKSKD